MNVTQPALSKTMGELQAGLGQQLFERTGRGLRPTPYGECMIRHARRLLQDLSDAGEELAVIATGTSRKVRVGTLPASAYWLVPRALMLFKQASPLAAIAVRESTMDVLLQELRLGNLDMIVGTLPSRNLGIDLEETTLLDEATLIVAGVQHPLASNSSPEWNLLARYPWVLPPHDSLLREPLLAALSASGVDPPVNFIETLSFNVTLNYLQGSEAIATLPASLARMHAESGVLAILPVEPSRLVRPVGLLWLRSQVASDGERQFIDCLEQAAAELAERERRRGGASTME